MFPRTLFPSRLFVPRFFPQRELSVPGSTQKERIHNALVAVAAEGTFYLTTYTPDLLMEQGNTVAPASVRANEVAGSFQEAPRNRRAAMQDRRTWRWKLYLGFHQEVTCEAFENELMSAPMWLPATELLRQARILLVDVTYTHPQQHGAAAGTSAVYTFEIQQSPA